MTAEVMIADQIWLTASELDAFYPQPHNVSSIDNAQTQYQAKFSVLQIFQDKNLTSHA